MNTAKGSSGGKRPRGREEWEPIEAYEARVRGQEVQEADEVSHEESLDDVENPSEAVITPKMIAVFVGLLVLAVLICIPLWSLTHKKMNPTPEGGPDVEANVQGEDTEIDGEQTDLPADLPLSEPSDEPDTPVVPETPTTPETPTASETPTAPETPTAEDQEPISGDASMYFTTSDDDVTAKDVTNLRSEPSTQNPDNIVGQLKNGEALHRIGLNSDTGWSKLENNGDIVYAVTRYLTTDLTYVKPEPVSNPNRVETKDGRVILFTDCDDYVTPKEYVNLRTEPSTSEGNATVSCQLNHGEQVHRTGYSPDAGWSRVEYDGKVLYVVSSYVEAATTE